MKNLTLLKTISMSPDPGSPRKELARTVSVTTPVHVLQTVSSGMPHTRKHSLDNVDLQFRLYKADGSGGMQRMRIPEDAVAKATESWEKVLSPTVGDHDRAAELSNLLDVAMEEPTVVPNEGTPKGLHRGYSGVYMMSPHHLVEEKPAPKESRFKKMEKGENTTTDYRVFLTVEGDEIVSPWHDLHLKNEDGTFNFVCEIPKNTSAKMEVATGESRTPIKQDIKKGQLRFYPYPISWNYGMLPQTWEDPAVVHEEVGAAGDNDPVDVVEIGSEQLVTGGVYRVKPLGAYAMIDDGELDWKIVCIRAEDPKAPLMHDIEDVEREMPGELEKVMIWFRDYKIPDGKPPNKYGFDSKPMNSDFAKMVIEETHGHYKNLKQGARVNDKELALE